MGFLDRLNDVGNAAPFSEGGGPSDIYANKNKMTIEFYHLPSDKSVVFKAFLTSWDDKFQSNYNSEDVFGRNDLIHTFQGTHREIAVSWDVVAYDAESAQENLGRVSLLAQFLYPAYKMESLAFSINDGVAQDLKVGTMTKAPLVKVRFANLIVDSKSQLSDPGAKESGLLCAMDGLQITTDLDGGVIDGLSVATPKIFKLSTNLKVLHQHTLGWDNNSKDWLGEDQASGYPYNAWGDGRSTSPHIPGSAGPPSGGEDAATATASGADAPPPPEEPAPTPTSPTEGDALRETFDDVNEALRNASGRRG
tara:strand:+ start:195 stop:1118 length:924 start_codon:yes stop_codon:yes gene_type:complete